jgi:hypothetical protein
MLFKKHVKPVECDQAPCGTGMHYLADSYKRTVSCPGSPFPLSCAFLVRTTDAQLPCRPTLCTAQRRAPRKARAPARTLCSACTRCSTTHTIPRMRTTSTRR